LIYYEAYLEQDDALGRERYLKSGAGRRFFKAQLKYYLRKYPLPATARLAEAFPLARLREMASVSIDKQNPKATWTKSLRG
jgi:hypothetical protein